VIYQGLRAEGWMRARGGRGLLIFSDCPPLEGRAEGRAA